MHHLGMRERTNFGRDCSFSFLWLRKNYSGMKRNGQGQIKTCRRKQHVKTGSVEGVPNLFCGIFAVGGNYNLMRNISESSIRITGILREWDVIHTLERSKNM